MTSDIEGLIAELRANAGIGVHGLLHTRAADALTATLKPQGVEAVAGLDGERLRDALGEVLPWAEIGLFLWDARSSCYGDRREQPEERTITWEWQQSTPDDYDWTAMRTDVAEWIADLISEDGPPDNPLFRAHGALYDHPQAVADAPSQTMRRAVGMRGGDVVWEYSADGSPLDGWEPSQPSGEDVETLLADMAKALEALRDELCGVDRWWGKLSEAADAADDVLAKYAALSTQPSPTQAVGDVAGALEHLAKVRLELEDAKAGEKWKAYRALESLDQALSALAAPKTMGKLTYRLAEFFREVVGEVFNGATDVCGGDIQDLAIKHHLLTETTYDPAKHGASDFSEPGDQWFVISDEVRSALQQGGSE